MRKTKPRSVKLYRETLLALDARPLVGILGGTGITYDETCTSYERCLHATCIHELCG